jgi:ribosomal protein S21
MAYVSLNEGETPESLVNRFRSVVQRSGILRELKNRRYFKTKSQKVREAAQRAARRARRRNRTQT